MAVELYGKGREENEVFDLSWSAWREFRTLARGFGWVPTEPDWYCPKTPEQLAAYEERKARLEAELSLFQGKSDLTKEEKLQRHILEFHLDPYTPVDWTYGDADMRLVTAEIAKAIAMALERALEQMEGMNVDIPHTGPFVITEGMTEAQIRTANGGISREYLRTFLGFLNRGAFIVTAWD